MVESSATNHLRIIRQKNGDNIGTKFSGKKWDFLFSYCRHGRVRELLQVNPPPPSFQILPSIYMILLLPATPPPFKHLKLLKYMVVKDTLS